MPVTTPEKPRPAVFNLPNQLTFIRLILSIVLFVFVDYEYFFTSFVLFIVAASTDWLDGYYARKYQMVTTLGRILDPFVDKVIVCGTFIYLLGISSTSTGIALDSGVHSWMVTIIVGRELLVTALRSFLEDHGKDFSAKWSGKVKMVLQCVAAAYCLLFLYLQAEQYTLEVWQIWLRDVLLWGTVATTVISGIGYVRTALISLRELRQL